MWNNAHHHFTYGEGVTAFTDNVLGISDLSKVWKDAYNHFTDSGK